MTATSGQLSKGYERVCQVLWAIALVCLPITSFPLFSSLSGALVAPLSILPFFVLLVIWTLPVIFHKGSLPRETLPLVVFVLVVLVSCAGAYFFFIPGFKGRTVPGQELRALVTLAVGLTFYLVTTTWVNDPEKLKSTMKYLTIGGIISLAWAGVQSFYILRHVTEYPIWLDQVQSWLVVFSPAFSAKYGRVNGLTYEASWFAHQLVIIYLPLWMAATYHRTSAFKFRIFHISVENFMLVFGLAAFFLSSPRIGLISLLLMVIYLFLRMNLAIHRRIVGRISKSKSTIPKVSSATYGNLINWVSSVSIILIYALILVGVLTFAVQRDWRLSTLVTNPPTAQEIIGLLTLDQNTLVELSHRFIFLERMVYWMNGWNIFGHYPWFGVGLGNSGFFFPQYAPAIGWSTFEIRNVLYYMTQLPNIKSLWFRLLAETGLIGFSVFITWLYVLYQSSRFSQRDQDVTLKTFAFAGQLALLALIGEGFSIDSFAMPYLWVAAGFIAAVALVSRRKSSQPAIDK